MKNNKVIILIILILSGVTAICFLPWQHKIDKKLNGFEKKIGNEKYNKKITIMVKGNYNQYLIKDDTFKGTISTNINGEIWNESCGEIIFNDNIGDITSWRRDSKGNLSSKNFGSLICDSNFNEILILVSEQMKNGSGWSSEDGLYISAPAKNKEESIKVAKNLSNKNSWLLNTLWE